jgi:hypothetical protein
MRQLKMRSERTQAAASSKLRFTPKRVFGAAAPVAAVAAPPPSPVRPSPVRQVAKKLTFPSPAPAGEMSRKRGAESAVRVVGSGPFSEARQKRAARALVLEDTESSQPDLVTAAAVTVAPARAPEPFDASARRLLFQLSPSGHTLVTVPRRAASPAAPQPDIFAELERLTISSGGKEAPSRKRTLVATPPRALRAAAGGPARVVAFTAPEEQAEEAPVKRGRTAPQTAAGANILSKMAPATSRIGGSAASRSVRAAPAAPAAPAPGTAPAGARAARNVSVEDIVLWEKRTGRVWQRLSAAEKAAELHGLKSQENFARFNF